MTNTPDPNATPQSAAAPDAERGSRRFATAWFAASVVVSLGTPMWVASGLIGPSSTALDAVWVVEPFVWLTLFVGALVGSFRPRRRGGLWFRLALLANAAPLALFIRFLVSGV